MAVLIVVIGILLLVVSGRALLQGRYVGGELDAGEEEEAQVEEVQDQTGNDR